MKIQLPYSRRRRYLTGIDWSIGMLDYISRLQTGVGNLSQVILEVEGMIEPTRLTDALAKISGRLPLIHGCVARDWLNLAPYWRVPQLAHTAVIPLQVVDLAIGRSSEADSLFADHVNRPLESQTQHLRFLLIRIGIERSRLGMVFDHRLFDACGAEAFLQLIQETSQGRLELIASQVRQIEPPHLNEWRRQFLGGQTVNRFRLQLAGRDVAALAMPPRRPGRRVRFLHDSLTPAQTSQFIEFAALETGVPILLPSAIARAVSAMHVAMPSVSQRGAQYLVAVSVDARSPDQKWEQLLFNHLSFLGFSVSPELSESTSGLVDAFRDQLWEQMRVGVPQAFQDATMLTRICPHWIAGRVARLTFKGQVCSFYFACLRDSAFTGDSFMGLRTINLIHTPRVPPPPGVGLCMTFFDGRLNIVLSYLDGVMEDPLAMTVLQQFKQRLISCVS